DGRPRGGGLAFRVTAPQRGGDQEQKQQTRQAPAEWRFHRTSLLAKLCTGALTPVLRGNSCSAGGGRFTTRRGVDAGRAYHEIPSQIAFSAESEDKAAGGTRGLPHTPFCPPTVVLRSAYERRHPRPVRRRGGRPPGGRATPAAGLRRA